MIVRRLKWPDNHTYLHFKGKTIRLVPSSRKSAATVHAVGKCIVIWGQVDNEMGNLFGLLLGTDSAAALEVFLSLRRFSTQREALQSAAKHKLQGQTLSLFVALVSVYGSLERERNALAHGCFGICPEDETILYWTEVKEHVHFQVEVLSQEAKGLVGGDRHKKLKEAMFVYRLSDLEEIYREMEEFWWAMFYFNGYLRAPENAGRIAEYEKLFEMPRIKAILARAPI